MGAAAAPVMVAGIGAQTYMSIQQQKAQAELESGMLGINRQNAEIMAQDALQRGEKDAATVRQRTRRVIGTQRASYGAQGVDVNQGSAAQVQDDTQAQGLLDESRVRSNAWREAFGLRTQADSLAMRQGMVGLSSRNDRNNTLITGGLRMFEAARSK